MGREAWVSDGLHHHEVRRALNIDLEEIKLLAEAAGMTDSPGIRYVLLKHICNEVHEAMFWNHYLARMDHMPPHYPPPYHPPYGPPPYDPPYGDPFTVKEKSKDTEETKDTKEK